MWNGSPRRTKAQEENGEDGRAEGGDAGLCTSKIPEPRTICLGEDPEELREDSGLGREMRK